MVGEKHFKRKSGIAAAILLCVSFGQVVACQDVKADIPASFFAILSMYFLLNYLDTHKIRDIVLTSIIAGVGAATKIYPIVMLIPIMISIVYIKLNQPIDVLTKIIKSSTLVFTSIIVFYSAYFFCAPFSFIDPLGFSDTFSPFIRLIKRIMQIFSGTVIEKPDDFIVTRTGVFGGFLDYFKTMVDPRGLGLVIFSLSFLGIIWVCLKNNIKMIIFLLFPICFLFLSVFTQPGYAAPRHQIPVYVFFTVCGGMFVSLLIEKFKSKEKLITILFLMSLIWPLLFIIQHGIQISKSDTRNLAKQWIEKNIKPESKLLMDENGPPILFNEKALKKSLKKIEVYDSNGKGQFTTHYDTYLKYQLLASKKGLSFYFEEIRFPWWRSSYTKLEISVMNTEYDKDMANPVRPVGVNNYDYYVNNNFNYAVVVSSRYKRFFDPKRSVKKKFPIFHEFYSELFKRGELIKEFIPLKGESNGPVVKIFKIR
ncbi:MAG: glycosyltransferase family 39 protein [Deltaproteobacteria bacterium]|nr:glycosyltransferase family 39 protein [Deltaproteobacteria bacterium]